MNEDEYTSWEKAEGLMVEASEQAAAGDLTYAAHYIQRAQVFATLAVASELRTANIIAAAHIKEGSIAKTAGPIIAARLGVSTFPVSS